MTPPASIFANPECISTEAAAAELASMYPEDSALFDHAEPDTTMDECRAIAWIGFFTCIPLLYVVVGAIVAAIMNFL